MAFAIDDRVKETSTTTGTGTYDLAGAVAGFQTFVAGIGTGNTTWYAATDGTGWEIGIGTVTDATPDTLARTTILSSSNADAAVNWGAGTKTITCSLPASRAFYDAGTAGQIPISSGSGGPITWAAKPAGFSTVRVYTTTGASTWSKPTGLSFIIVEAVGGGGGGGGSIIAAGSGGGAGGYARKTIAAASLAATETVTVGGGGAGGTSGGTGSAGGLTTFGAFLSACGGAPGVSGVSGLALTAGGVGGVATSGDLNVQGGDGTYATAVASGAAATWEAGNGGSSFFGGGGAGIIRAGVSGTVVGTPRTGRAFGSGGAGGVAATSVAVSGGNGANGVVLVWEFI